MPRRTRPDAHLATRIVGRPAPSSGSRLLSAAIGATIGGRSAPAGAVAVARGGSAPMPLAVAQSAG